MKRLICKSVSKKYEGTTKALNNVSFAFDGNGIISMIGRNGAGKTTLIRIISTELMPSSGKIYLDGIDVVKDPDSAREIMAIVPQEARTIPWLTCKQTIITSLLYRGFGYGEASDRARKALKRMGIDQYTDKLTRRLSGGTKRKLMVASALAGDAKVIFLDEPTTGLDPISRGDLWATLEELKKEYLIFLTTHYLEEAEKLADKIGIMEHGKLLAYGTMDDLRKRIKYEYSIRVYNGNFIKTNVGIGIQGIDGTRQIMTSEKEAFKLSKELIRRKCRFSSNPVTLEDIFYFIVKKPIDDENEEKQVKPDTGINTG